MVPHERSEEWWSGGGSNPGLLDVVSDFGEVGGQGGLQLVPDVFNITKVDEGECYDLLKGLTNWRSLHHQLLPQSIVAEASEECLLEMKEASTDGS